MATSPHVVLGRLSFHAGQHGARLMFPHGLGPEVCAADGVWPDEVRMSELVIRGSKRLRGTKRLAGLQQLETGSGHHWVVRRDAAEAIAALAPPGDVRVVPAPLVDADGWLDPDWALIDVRAVFPLDRQAAGFQPAVAGAPHGSLVERVTRVAFAAERGPACPLFRIAEAPELLVAREDVAAQIRSVLGPWVVPLSPPYDGASYDGKPCAKLRGIGGLHRGTASDAPPLPHDEDTGRAAFEALYRMLAGRTDRGDRARACESPITAYFVARLVDRAPAEDTRAGAIRHPRYAALYARDVDGAPRDDTRRAVLSERFSSFEYFAAVERAAHPALIEKLGAADVARALEESSRLRAAARPAVPGFPPEWQPPSGPSVGAASPARRRRSPKAKGG